MTLLAKSLPFLFVHCLWVLVLAMAPGASTYAQGLRMVSLRIEGFHPLDEQVAYANPLMGSDPAVLKLNSSLFSDNEVIDFEKRQVTFSRKDKLGFAIWSYHYPELSEYLLGRRRYSLYKGWYDHSARRRTDAAEKRGLPALELVMPVQYPDWAQRILGKEPPKLTIDGQLKLTVGFERERFTQTDRIGTDGILFEQENRFSVRGTIGRVVDINISTNSEESFDVGNQLKNFKVEYKGDGNELEDEVIQEVTAGFTGFSMPGTDLSGYSESHEGLFGIRIKSQIGPLELTTIVSTEQGEPEELNIRKSSGTSASSLMESDLVRYRYFWIDTLYKKQYLGRVAGGDTVVGLPSIKTIQVWVQVDQIEKAAGNTDVNKVLRYATTEDSTEAFYKRLTRDVHYEVSAQDGWIRIDSGAVIDDRATRIGLFVTFDGDGTLLETRGDTTFTGDKINNYEKMRSLWLLKKFTPEPTDPTFGLEWRNVYRGPRGELGDDFKVSVKRIAEGTVDSTHELQSERLFSDILGLTDKSGVVLDRRVPGFIKPVMVFDKQRGLLVLPPFADASIGQNPFANPDLDKVNTGAARIINEKIYSLSYRDFTQENFRDQYRLEITGVAAERQATFDLGWGVMKNTEKVMAGGVTLERYKDYTIDYDMGTVTLVSKRALAENDIRITYQREALFVPETKQFFGARGELRLPFISNNAFAAASVLFQVTKSRDDIPRIGHEPYSKLLLDINTKMDWEPTWMTKLVDLIPLIKTQATSRIDLELEVAHSRMNPNTSDSKEAYIDDFEASKQVTPLGDSYKSWFRASPPVAILDSLLFRPMAWLDYWFNPHSSDEEHRIEKDLIWNLDREAQSSQDKYESVLKLVAQLRPKPVDSPVDTLADTLSDTLARIPKFPQISNRFDNPWTGIMTYLSPGLADRSKDKYLEFWVRSNVVRDTKKNQFNLRTKNSNGVLYVDLGVLSEDISIDGGPPDNNSQPATEDTSGLGYFNIETDDLGIDFRDSTQEYWVVPNESRTGWDTLRLDDPRLPFPRDPARDNYAYYGRNYLGNRSKVNGTQFDAEINPGPSTEDINGDGYMDLRHQERYFRYRIDLDSLMRFEKSQFLDTTANRNPDGRFYRIRIPLNDSGLVDAIQRASAGTAPSFRDIRGVRFFWSDFDQSDSYVQKELELARIQFVGNQWLPRTVLGNDPANPSVGVVEASVVNNEDDKDYKDQFLTGSDFPLNPQDFVLATGGYKREQSLKMTFTDIQAGDTALIDRWYSYHPFDFSMYKQIKLDVYSKNDHSSDSVRAVLRFGTDSATYYQVSSDVLVSGWRGNEIVCDLKALTDGKLEYVRLHGQNDTINYASSDGRYQAKASGRSVPNLSRVSWIAVGIVRGGDDLNLVEGEVWFNNLRVDGTSVLAGSAARGRLRTQWADFMNLSTEFNYQDGDFRKMTETQIRAGDSRLDVNVAADFKLDKFIPAELGVAIPLGMRASTAVTRPQLAPNSDATLKKDNGDADRLSDMAKDAVDALVTRKSFNNGDVTNAEHYQTTRTARSINTSFDKTVRSDFLPTNLTLDRLSVDGRYNRSDEHRHQGAHSTGDDDYIDSTITRTYGGDLDYDLSPQDAPKWTRWKPFGESKAGWVGSRLKGRELTFLPRTLRFDLADNVNYTDQRKHTARSGIDDDRKTLTMGHGMRLDYSPISSVIDIGFGTNLSRDFNELLNGENAQSLNGDFVVDNVLKKDLHWKKFNVLNSETRRTQDASLAFRPQFFDWLTHAFTYRANYGHGFSRSPVNKDERLMDASVDGNFKFDSDFQFGELFRAAAKRMEKIAFANTLFENMRTGFDKVSLRSIRFEYDAGSSLKNMYLEKEFMAARIDNSDYFLYKLGLLRSDNNLETLRSILEGGYDDETAFGGMLYRSGYNDDPAGYSRDSRRATQKYSLSSSFKIPGIDLSFNSVRVGWENSYTVTPDTSRSDSSETIPDLRVSANTPFLNKIDFISKSFQRVNLATGYNYRHTRTIQHSSGQSTQRDSWAHEFSPLFKVDGTLRKRPIRFSYSYSYDRKADKGNTRDVNITSRTNANLNYDIPQAKTKREIKVLKWTVPVEGRTNLGVNIDFSNSKGYIGLTDSVQQRTQLPGGVEPTTESSTRSLKPELTYVFTSKINGKAIIDWTKTTSTTETHRRYVQIAATVDIKF